MRSPAARSLILVAVAVSVGADAPLRPPAILTRCSANGQYCATANPALQTVVVHEGAGHKLVLWSIKGWERVFDVSDSGDHLVACSSGLNLLPLDYSREEPLVTFYHRGKLVRRVSVGELFPDPRKLRRTVSHYHWGSCSGFDGPRTYKVDTVDRGILRFDVTTGTVAADVAPPAGRRTTR
jgi:hypothetical protein